MAILAKNGHNGVHELNAAEPHTLFEEAARYYVHMSGEEFLRRYERGEFFGRMDEEPALRRMKMLLPFGR